MINMNELSFYSFLHFIFIFIVLFETEGRQASVKA